MNDDDNDGLSPPVLARKQTSIEDIVREDESANYDRIYVSMRHEMFSDEQIEVARGVCRALLLRYKYMSTAAVSAGAKLSRAQVASLSYEMRQGIVYVRTPNRDDLVGTIQWKEFESDIERFWRFVKDPKVKSNLYHRLELMEERFKLYSLLNRDMEATSVRKKLAQNSVYTIAKVDNHIHAAAMMTSNHLLRFMKDKFESCGDEIVYVDKDSGEKWSLSHVFSRVGWTTDHALNADALDVEATHQMYGRFDKFNEAYNPFGDNVLRNVFLKTDNYIEGRYLAELCREVFERTFSNDTTNNVMLEPRISVYGASMGDWDRVASWAVDNGLCSYTNAMWLVQFPRIYSHLRSQDRVQNFEEYLKNLFIPLFEVTMDESSHPKLAKFLEKLAGIDVVDDESLYDVLVPREFKNATDFVSSERPGYAYTLYHVYSNLRALNFIRMSRGLPVLKLRPHCGEAGEMHHLCSGYLLAHSINHGINLKYNPALQYMYYITQIGLSISPLSNNQLFCKLRNNPFDTMLRRGLNVALSTDDPLQFHTTQEPLLEEYTIARKLYNLSVVDLAEIARNSVLQSGFPETRKAQILGERYLLPGVAGNDISRTNIPMCRESFRHNNMLDEQQFLWNASRGKPMDNTINNTLRMSHSWKWLIAESIASNLFYATSVHNASGRDKEQLSFKPGDVVIILSFNAEEPTKRSVGFNPKTEDQWHFFKNPTPSATKLSMLDNDENLEEALLSAGKEWWFGRDTFGREGIFPSDAGYQIHHREPHMHFLFGDKDGENS